MYKVKVLEVEQDPLLTSTSIVAVVSPAKLADGIVAVRVLVVATKPLFKRHVYVALATALALTITSTSAHETANPFKVFTVTTGGICTDTVTLAEIAEQACGSTVLDPVRALSYTITSTISLSSKV